MSDTIPEYSAIVSNALQLTAKVRDLQQKISKSGETYIADELQDRLDSVQATLERALYPQDPVAAYKVEFLAEEAVARIEDFERKLKQKDSLITELEELKEQAEFERDGLQLQVRGLADHGKRKGDGLVHWWTRLAEALHWDMDEPEPSWPDLITGVDTLRAECDDLSSDVQKLQSEVEGVTKHRDQMRAKVNGVKDELATMTQDRDNWRLMASCIQSPKNWYATYKQVANALGHADDREDIDPPSWGQMLDQIKADREFLLNTNAAVVWPKLEELVGKYQHSPLLLKQEFAKKLRDILYSDGPAEGGTRVRSTSGGRADTRAGFKFYKNKVNGMYYRAVPSGKVQFWSDSERWVPSCMESGEEQFSRSSSEISWDELPDNGALASAYEVDDNRAERDDYQYFQREGTWGFYRRRGESGVLEFFHAVSSPQWSPLVVTSLPAGVVAIAFRDLPPEARQAK